MVSIFARSARVVVSATPGADNSLLAQEQRPATRPSAAIECTSNGAREAHLLVFIMGRSYKVRRNPLRNEHRRQTSLRPCAGAPGLERLQGRNPAPLESP